MMTKLRNRTHTGSVGTRKLPSECYAKSPEENRYDSEKVPSSEIRPQNKFKGAFVTGGRKRTRLSNKHKLAGIFFASIAIYANTLKGTFLHDDIPAILRNPDVRGDAELSALLENDFWGTAMTSNTSHKSYRPICVLTFRIEKAFFGYDALSFHLTNVLLHSIVSVMFTVACRTIFFGSVEKHGGDQRLPYLCGLLFALHPIHTEAVAGLVGRAELLSAAFYLLSVLCYHNGAKLNTDCVHDHMRAEETGRKPARLKEGFNMSASIAFAALAMLCKETGLTALGVVLSLELFTLCRAVAQQCDYSILPLVTRTRWILLRLVCVGACVATLLYMRLSIMGWKQPYFAGPDNPASKSPHLRVRFLTYSYLAWVNFELLLFPVNLVYDWSYGTIPLIVSWSDQRNIATVLFGVSCATTVMCVVVSNLHSRQISPLVYSILLLIIPYLPASNLLFPVGFVIAERTLYLPSMGFAVFMVLAWKSLCKHFPRLERVFHAALLVLLLFYGVKTWLRNEDWCSKGRLFRSGVEVAPNNAKVHYNWANFLRDSGRYKEAAAEYEKTLGLYPTYAGALNNLATILEMDEATSLRAEELYVRLIRTEPGRADAYRNLADLLMRKKRYDRAIEVYSRLLDARGTNFVDIISLAELFKKHDMAKHAERLYVRVLAHYCSIQSDEKITNILRRSADVAIVRDVKSCISSVSDLPRVLRGYADLKAKNGHTEDSDILFQRILSPDEVQ